MPKHPKHISTGQSQITINKIWVAIVVVIVLVFSAAVGAMFYVTATARPPTVETGGYK